ncbi:MAG: hypothetical protein KIS94_00820 [Chitinophagales bacterium]|nr:hypothetical protein [Chitinophagales bacterium]
MGNFHAVILTQLPIVSNNPGNALCRQGITGGGVWLFAYPVAGQFACV